MKLLCLLAALSMVSTAYASNWNEEMLETNGMKIRLSWQTQNFSEGPSGHLHVNGYAAKPLYVEVWTDARHPQTNNSSAQARVQVVLNSLCISSYYGTTHSDSTKIDLTYDKNDHYYGVINEGLSISYNTYYEGFKCRQNMAVVKEGQWFKDRNTGKNFEFILH